jgi:hypothetical protein
MFSNNEITERGRLHRVLAGAAEEVTLAERLVWARAIDGAIKDAATGSFPFRARVARPIVVLGAAPALAAVAAVLRNEDIAVSREMLDAVRGFMTDGVDSPLYGSDPLAARRGADALRRELAATEVAQRATAASAA